jgi:hypothetical protein
VRLARRFRPDVLHAHWWLPAGICGLVASRLTGVPLVVTLHGTDVHLLRHGLLRRLGGAVLRRAELVVVVSEDLRRSVVDALGLPAERVQVLRMPVERVPDAHAAVAGGRLRLVAAGRLSVEKGFDVLLEALRLAVADGLDVELELVGLRDRARPAGRARRDSERPGAPDPGPAPGRPVGADGRRAGAGRPLSPRGPRAGGPGGHRPRPPGDRQPGRWPAGDRPGRRRRPARPTGGPARPRPMRCSGCR